MLLTLFHLCLGNFTVFNEIAIDFASGINVLIGENGTGKTHILKLLYAFLEGETYTSKNVFFENICNCFHTERLIDLFGSDDKRLTIHIGVNESNFLYKVTYAPKQTDDKKPTETHEDMNTEMGIQGDRKKDDAPVVFIPAKEMLTHAGLEKDYMERSIPFDKSLIDILFKSGVSELRKLTPESQQILDNIQRVIGGTVIYEDNQYYVLHDKLKISFQSEAEGFKKLSVLWRLIENGTLSKGAVLFWDEPEANINPSNLSLLTEILFALQRSGIQIFVATHNYVLAKYLDLKKTEQDKVLFHSFYKEEGRIYTESAARFMDLKHNAIADAYDKLMDEVFKD